MDRSLVIIHYRWKGLFAISCLLHITLCLPGWHSTASVREQWCTSICEGPTVRRRSSVWGNIVHHECQGHGDWIHHETLCQKGRTLFY